MDDIHKHVQEKVNKTVAGLEAEREYNKVNAQYSAKVAEFQSLLAQCYEDGINMDDLVAGKLEPRAKTQARAKLPATMNQPKPAKVEPLQPVAKKSPPVKKEKREIHVPDENSNPENVKAFGKMKIAMNISRPVTTARSALSSKVRRARRSVSMKTACR